MMDHEWPVVLRVAHDSQGGGHYEGKATKQKVLHIGVWWSTLFTDITKYTRIVIFIMLMIAAM
jgi:hypothetical protein